MTQKGNWTKPALCSAGIDKVKPTDKESHPPVSCEFEKWLEPGKHVIRDQKVGGSNPLSPAMAGLIADDVERRFLETVETKADHNFGKVHE